MKISGHALYFSEDLLLPPPHTYFLIDSKEISSKILVKWGSNSPQTVPMAMLLTATMQNNNLPNSLVRTNVAASVGLTTTVESSNCT